MCTHEYLFGMKESKSPPPFSVLSPLNFICPRLWIKKFHCVNQELSDSSIMREKVAAASAGDRSGRRARCTYRTASLVIPGMPEEAIWEIESKIQFFFSEQALSSLL